MEVLSTTVSALPAVPPIRPSAPGLISSTDTPLTPVSLVSLRPLLLRSLHTRSPTVKPAHMPKSMVASPLVPSPSTADTGSAPTARATTGLYAAVPCPPGWLPLLSLSTPLSSVTGTPPVAGKAEVGVSFT